MDGRHNICAKNRTLKTSWSLNNVQHITLQNTYKEVEREFSSLEENFF